jgi:hypothetical protein
MEKRTTPKKVMKLSAETLCQLETKEAREAGPIPGTQASGITCCP